jgi:SAM-dependent methyltransferase
MSTTTFQPAEPALTERALALPRAKPRYLSISLAYRLKSISQWVLGRKTLLRLLLNASWLFHRFAHELNAELGISSPPTGNPEPALHLICKCLPPSGSVVDVGCGLGYWCRLLAAHAGKVVGIDYSAEHLNEARRRTTATNVEYRLGDVTANPPNERYDVALLHHVLEHIDDADGLLYGLHRVTEVVVIGVPDFETDVLNPVRMRLGTIWWSDGDHVREYTREILRDQLERNGWDVRHCDSHTGTLLALATRRVGWATAEAQPAPARRI